MTYGERPFGPWCVEGFRSGSRWRFAGHKTRSVFDHYNIVSDGDLRTAAQQLSGLTGTIQGQSGTLSPTAGSETIKIAK